MYHSIQCMDSIQSNLQECLCKSCRILQTLDSLQCSLLLSSYFSWKHFTSFRLFLDPQLRPKRSYELGSVRPSIIPSFCPLLLLSGGFLGIGSLFFSEIQHGVRGPCGIVFGSARFFEKIIFPQKMDKMGQKQDFLNLLENLVINFF